MTQYEDIYLLLPNNNSNSNNNSNDDDDDNNNNVRADKSPLVTQPESSSRVPSGVLQFCSLPCMPVTPLITETWWPHLEHRPASAIPLKTLFSGTVVAHQQEGQVARLWEGQNSLVAA